MSSRHIRGAWVFNTVKRKTDAGDYTILDESVFIAAKAAGQATGVVLPAAGGVGTNQRRAILVLDGKGDAATNNITATVAGGGTINGGASHVISENYGKMLYVDTGTEWMTALPAEVSAAELAFLNGVTAGTGAVSKALVLDANGDVTMPLNGSIGFGSVGKVSWDSTDANANALLIQLPTGGGVNVPAIVIGQGIEGVDLGLYNGITEPRLALLAMGATATGPVLETRKARGTIAAPTVVTTGDDCGVWRAFGCVANGEYVQSCEILMETAGTIATTRGPGTITFKTATDAAPSVLTPALKITASQDVIIGSGAASQSLTFDTSGTDVVLAASSAALAMGAITLNVTGTRFVQSYHTNLTSTNAVTVDSSETVKRNIVPYQGDALDVVDRMDVITFKHNEHLDPSGQTKLGIRAESVAEPLVIQQIDREGGGNYPGVNLYGLLAVLVKATQQIGQRLTELEKAA